MEWQWLAEEQKAVAKLVQVADTPVVVDIGDTKHALERCV
jgi:hypothetical protein